MSYVTKSKSFPEDLNDVSQREREYSIQTINAYQAKDQERTEHLADIGASSSYNIVIIINMVLLYVK